MHYLLISTQSRLRTSSLSARVSHTTSLVAIKAQSVVDKDNFGLRPCDSWYLNAAWSANHWKVNGGLSNRGEKETTYKNIYHLKKLFSSIVWPLAYGFWCDLIIKGHISFSVAMVMTSNIFQYKFWLGRNCASQRILISFVTDHISRMRLECKRFINTNIQLI